MEKNTKSNRHLPQMCHFDPNLPPYKATVSKILKPEAKTGRQRAGSGRARGGQNIWNSPPEETSE